MKPSFNSPEWQAFLADICARPWDWTPRLVAADWLDENDGERTCPQCGGAGEESISLPIGDLLRPCLVCNGAKALPNGFAARAELIRAMCDNVDISIGGTVGRRLVDTHDQRLKWCDHWFATPGLDTRFVVRGGFVESLLLAGFFSGSARWDAVRELVTSHPLLSIRLAGVETWNTPTSWAESNGRPGGHYCSLYSVGAWDPTEPDPHPPSTLPVELFDLLTGGTPVYGAVVNGRRLSAPVESRRYESQAQALDDLSAGILNRVRRALGWEPLPVALGKNLADLLPAEAAAVS